jgi:hypothetical protein
MLAAVCHNGIGRASAISRKLGESPRNYFREMAMLSGRLVHLIEEHWEEIADSVVNKIRRHPDLTELPKRPEAELKQWCQEILTNLGYWLSAPKAGELKRRYEVLGRARFEQSIPLHEAVLRFFILKDKIVDFVHQQGFAPTSMQLYAEEELEHSVGQFFDAMVYNLVRGYENAMRLAQRVAS